MKKLLLLGIVATLLTVGASAQNSKQDFRKDGSGAGFKKDGAAMNSRNDGPRKDFRASQLTRGEKARMNHNSASFARAKHRAGSDGKFSSKEKKRLHKMKKHNRHDAFRYKHNDHKRGR